MAPKYYRSSDAGNIWCLFAQLLLAPVLPCLASPRFDWAPPSLLTIAHVVCGSQACMNRFHSYFYPRHSYTWWIQPLRIRAGASPICLNPMTLTYVKKSTFTCLGGTEFFFPILCQDGKIFLGRTNPRKCLTNNSIQPKKNEEKSSPRFFKNEKVILGRFFFPRL